VILYLGGYGDVTHELTIQVCILKRAITRCGVDLVGIRKAK